MLIVTVVSLFIVGGLIHAGSRGYARFPRCFIDRFLTHLISFQFHFRFGAYFWPALMVWGLDRFLRLARIVWNNRFWSRASSEDHQASIELLGSDTVRLTLRRKMHWSAGQHAYVILPSVSRLPTEAHPFTIASIPGTLDGSAGPAEKKVTFLIRGRTGFTGRLRELASTKGSVSSIPAFIDGPYGCPPDLRNFSTCILIAGGSGVSYILPLLLETIR